MCSDRQENLRIAYQVAVDFVRSEEQGIWARFNVMLLANSIAVSAIAVLINENNKPILTLVMSILGIILCIMWFFLIQRGFAYREYFVLSARELEACLHNPFEILTRGKKFSKGDMIFFHFPESPYKMSFHCLSPECIAYLVITAFVIIGTILKSSDLSILSTEKKTIW